jgi:hypothetical protein
VASTNKKNTALSGQARALFAERSLRILPLLAKTIQDRLTSLVDQPAGAREMQDRRDGWLAFQKSSGVWVQNTTAALTRARSQALVTPTSKLPPSGSMELMGNEVMENKIIASRLALRLLDFASWELSDLRLRIQHLDDISELHKDDIFRPEVVARHLVEQWTAAPLPRELWLSVQDLIQKTLAEQMLEVYHATNEFLVQQGVMAEIDLRPMMKRTPSAVRTGFGGEDSQLTSRGAESMPPDSGNPSRYQGDRGGPTAGGRGNSNAAGNVANGASGNEGSAAGSGRATAGGRPTQRNSGPGYSVSDETRMQTATTPLTRAKMRVQGVMGHC